MLRPAAAYFSPGSPLAGWCSLCQLSLITVLLAPQCFNATIAILPLHKLSMVLSPAPAATGEPPVRQMSAATRSLTQPTRFLAAQLWAMAESGSGSAPSVFQLSLPVRLALAH